MKKYNFHDDFDGINKIKINTASKLVLSLLNGLFKLQSRFVKTPETVIDKDYTIRGYNGLSLKIKVITPKNQSDKLPALLFLHGGGFSLDVSAPEIFLADATLYLEFFGIMTVA